MDKNILLICWDFPPNQGIGGRRWGKFAKQLASEGYTIHVIKTSPQKNNQVSPWYKDVKKENIITYEIPTHWAVKWLHDYNSPLSALRIRIAKVFLESRYKGTIFDKATGKESQIITLAEKLISTYKIKNVIATGAPFNLLFYAARLKKQHPDLCFIADYRDPWLNSVNYGMNHLDEKRKKQEAEKQNFVFENADYITAPNEFLLEQIKETYKGNKSPAFRALSHIYDPEDFVKQENKKQEDVFRLVYAGALYTDSEKYLDLLFEAVKQLQNRLPALKISVDIYTEHKNNVAIGEKLKNTVNIQKPIGDKIFDIIGQYDMIVILLTHHNKDFKTTKFFEFLPYKVPYLYTGPEGFVSKSIEDDQIGVHLKNENDLFETYSRLQEFKGAGITAIEAYSLKEVTRHLSSVFN